MSTRGTRLALAFAFLIAFALPRRVTCGYPGATCGHAGRWGTTCTDFEIEPMGFYLIEQLAHTNIGFAYSRGNDCQ